MPNKPQSRQAINAIPGKTSYLVLKKKAQPFPDLYDPGRPRTGTIYAVSVADDDNPGKTAFTATLVEQASGLKKRLAVKLVTQISGFKEEFAQDLLDGLLTITLHIVTALPPAPNLPPLTTPEPVTDVPVDYIYDPSAP